MGRVLTYVLLLIVALAAGFYFYQRNILPIAVTAADLEKGGNFSAEERGTLKTACAQRIKKDTDTVCGCIADKVASDFSRFDRLLITASFQERLSDIVALTKGLVQSGVPADKIQSAEEGNKARVKEMLKACNAE